MPTYDYICNACKQSHEIFHSMSEAQKTQCPSCKKDALEKQISGGSGIIFKGTGFYETDYKKKGSGEAPKTCKDGKTSCACS